MTLDDFVSRLDGVKKTSSGILARCPSHDDQSPSLSVKEGERGLLLKCWSGCTLEEIVAALGLTLTNLFYDDGLPRQSQKPLVARPRSNLTRIAFQFRFHGMLLFLRARSVLDAASHLVIESWTDAELDQALDAVARAYRDVERADLLETVACDLRAHVLSKRGRRDAA
jgi:hypothetical protein